MLRIIAILVTCLGLQSEAADPTPEELLKVSDRSRGGLASTLTWQVEIESSEKDSKSTRGFEITARGVDALAKATSPSRNKGEVFLFNDRSLWFYKPGLRKPVGISSRQRLTGETSNGDIATTNYSRDYTPAALPDEKVEEEPCYVMDLKSKNPSTTYDRIKYWISKKTRLAVKAQFQTPEGKALKNAFFKYGNTIQYEGKKLPFVSEMEIQDALMAQNKSVLKYQAPKTTEAPASVFNVNSLMR
jgi:outer membrane lipoprotein-sorting protein